MKKLTIFTLLAFVLTFFSPLTHLAKAEFPKEPYKVGYTEEQLIKLIEDNKIYDLRKNKQGTGKSIRSVMENPQAGFSIFVNGKETAAYNRTDLDEAPVYIEVTSTDEITFKNTSIPNKGCEPWVIDPQYLIYPDEGKTRWDYPVEYMRSLPRWTAGENRDGKNPISLFDQAIQKAKTLGVDCYIELYLAVSDRQKLVERDPYTGNIIREYYGDPIWSTNGTFGMWKTPQFGSTYPNGNTWYFVEMLIRVNHEPAPDFCPTTDKYLYVGNPGDTVNVDVKLNNNGVKGTTNLGWIESGGSWSKPNVIASSVTLDEGEYKDYKLEFEVPEQGQEKKVTFRANLNDKTPASEVYLENNQLTITIKANEEQYIKSNLSLSEKRITEKHDLKDIGGIPTFTFEYPSAGYHTWTECDDDG